MWLQKYVLVHVVIHASPCALPKADTTKGIAGIESTTSGDGLAKGGETKSACSLAEGGEFKADSLLARIEEGGVVHLPEGGGTWDVINHLPEGAGTLDPFGLLAKDYGKDSAVYSGQSSAAVPQTSKVPKYLF